MVSCIVRWPGQVWALRMIQNSFLALCTGLLVTAGFLAAVLADTLTREVKKKRTSLGRFMPARGGCRADRAERPAPAAGAATGAEAAAEQRLKRLRAAVVRAVRAGVAPDECLKRRREIKSFLCGNFGSAMSSVASPDQPSMGLNATILSR